MTQANSSKSSTSWQGSPIYLHEPSREDLLRKIEALEARLESCRLVPQQRAPVEYRLNRRNGVLPGRDGDEKALGIGTKSPRIGQDPDPRQGWWACAVKGRVPFVRKFGEEVHANRLVTVDRHHRPNARDTVTSNSA